MLSRWFRLAGVAFVLLGHALPAIAQTPALGALSGRVLASETGQPIIDAHVQLDGTAFLGVTFIYANQAMLGAPRTFSVQLQVGF